jgi:hypothetical protein
VPLTCTAPRSFAPTRSALGQLVRRCIPDARQAEAAYWVVLVVLTATALLLGHWAWLALAGAAGPAEVLVATMAGLALAAFAFAGWQPEIAVTVTEDRLRVRRGSDTCDVPLDRVATTRRVPATEAHAHWLRYAATRAFVNRMPEELLLLRTADGMPVLVGLPEPELERLEAEVARDYVDA